MGIFSFITGNPKLLMAGAALLVLLGMLTYIGILKHSVTNLKEEKIILEQKLEISQASVTSLRASIDEQNNAIQKMKKDADDREKLHKIEIKKAQDVAIKLKDKSIAIMKRQPPQNLNKCDAAHQLISEEVKNAK